MSPFEVAARLLALMWVGIGPLPLVGWALRRARADLAASPFGSAHLAAIVLWSALQVALGLLLGVVHRLNGTALLAGESVLLAGGLVLWLRSGGEPSLRPLLCPVEPLSRAQGAMLFSALVMTLSVVWVTLARCVENFDSLAYHLPIMARWVAEGWFARFDELGQTSRYPLHGELLSILFVLPWRDDLFVALPNVLSWLHLGLAAGVLARRLGASTEAATAAAVLLLACPTLLDRVSAIQPDIALAAYFVTAIVFLHASWLREDRARSLWWAWLSLSMLVGLKTSAWGYAGLALAGAWILAPRSWRGLRVLPARGVTGTMALVAMIALGAFWYVRNWLQVGNPLGLVEVKLGGLTLLAGSLEAEALRRTTIAALFDVARADHWRVLSRVAGNWLGLPAAALTSWAIAGALVALARRRVRPSHAVFVAGVGLAAFVIYWNSPYSGDNGTHGWQVTPWIHVGLRYAYPLLAIVAVAAGLGMKSLGGKGAWLAPWPVAACVLQTQWTVLPGIGPLRLAVLVALLATLAMTRPVRGRIVATSALAILVGVGTVLLAAPRRDADRIATYGSSYAYLEQGVPADAVVGAVNVPRLYPLFGRDWSRHVVDAVPAAGDRAAWAAQLRRDGIEVLVVGHADPVGEIDPGVVRAQRWVREGAPFELLRDVDSVRADVAVYRLRR